LKTLEIAFRSAADGANSPQFRPESRPGTYSAPEHFHSTTGKRSMEWHLLLLLLLGIQIPIFVLIWLLRDLRSK
jgi:hypothetical protein